VRKAQPEADLYQQHHQKLPIRFFGPGKQKKQNGQDHQRRAVVRPLQDRRSIEDTPGVISVTQAFSQDRFHAGEKGIGQSLAIQGCKPRRPGSLFRRGTVAGVPASSQLFTPVLAAEPFVGKGKHRIAGPTIIADQPGTDRRRATQQKDGQILQRALRHQGRFPGQASSSQHDSYRQADHRRRGILEPAGQSHRQAGQKSASHGQLVIGLIRFLRQHGADRHRR